MDSSKARQNLEKMIAQCKWSQNIWLVGNDEACSYVYASSDKDARLYYATSLKFEQLTKRGKAKPCMPAENLDEYEARLIY